MEQSIQKLLSDNKVNGLRQVKRELQAANILKVILALDADDFVKNEVLEMCLKCGITVLTTPSKEELGKYLNLDVNCSVVGLIKNNLAKSRKR